ncbi:MAG: methyl-accepting chemotaxis protein [Phycisphaeraceae bacterium]|nr:methyl-accepting chemotaxis protein [Phycisphaeraceae bacterium]
MRIRDWSVRTRLMVVLGLLGLVSASFAVTAMFMLERIKVNGPIYKQVVMGKDLIADILPPPEYIIESYLVTLQMETESDPAAIKQLVERCAALRKDYDIRHQVWLDELPEGEMRETMLKDSYDAALAFYDVLDRVFIPAVLAGDRATATSAIQGPMKQAYQQHRQAIDRVVQLATESNAQVEANASAINLQARRIMIGFATGLLLAVAILGGLLARSLLKPINAINERLRDIADGEGDLTRRVPEDRADELGQMCRSFNRLINRVQQVLIGVQQAAEQVAAASTQITAQAECAANGMVKQSDQAGLMTQSVMALSDGVGDAVRQSNEASKAAAEAGQCAADGGQRAQKNVDDIRDIAEVIRQSADAIHALGRRGEEIGRVVSVIDDIADQTNLLALNAAIEAARAGEQGRGFAVVADEVRKLAERTTRATREVAQSIKAVQEDTKSAVARMNDGMIRIDEGVHHVEETGAALTSIVTSAQQVAEMIRSIAHSMQNQSAAMDEISTGIEDMTTISRQSAEGAKETVMASASLADKSTELEQMVCRFKLR